MRMCDRREARGLEVWTDRVPFVSKKPTYEGTFLLVHAWVLGFELTVKLYHSIDRYLAACSSYTNTP